MELGRAGGVALVAVIREWKNLHVDVNDRGTGLLIGYGTHNDTFQVSALQNKAVSVDIDIVASASEIKTIVLNECLMQGHVEFVSTGWSQPGLKQGRCSAPCPLTCCGALCWHAGTVEAKIWSQSLGTIKVGPFIEIILCS